MISKMNTTQINNWHCNLLNRVVGSSSSLGGRKCNGFQVTVAFVMIVEAIRFFSEICEEALHAECLMQPTDGWSAPHAGS